MLGVRVSHLDRNPAGSPSTVQFSKSAARLNASFHVTCSAFAHELADRRGRVKLEQSETQAREWLQDLQQVDITVLPILMAHHRLVEASG